MMCNAMTRHSFLNRQTMYQGRATMIAADSLHNILTMYRDIRARDQIVTLNILAAERKRLDRSVQGLYLAAIRRRIWHHIKKHGVVRRRMSHVAKNTRYEKIIIQGWVSYVNRSIKIGNYKACDLVNIDENNVDLDLASGMTLAGCGK
jgi:hypothetical protein